MQKYLADLDNFTLQIYKNIDILDVIYLISDSWRSIKTETIKIALLKLVFLSMA